MLQINTAGNVWFYYWEAVTVILKLAGPIPIGSVCVLLAVWGIATSRKGRAALIRTSTSTSNSVLGLGRHRSSTNGAAGGTSKNTKAMIYLCGIYILVGLPNIFVYILIIINTVYSSCTINFVALLAKDLFTPVVCFTLFTRIFDGLIFLVIPEFRAAILNILHFRFYTKVS